MRALYFAAAHPMWCVVLRLGAWCQQTLKPSENGECVSEVLTPDVGPWNCSNPQWVSQLGRSHKICLKKELVAL